VNGLYPNSGRFAVPFIKVVGTWRWLCPEQCRVSTHMVTIHTGTKWGLLRRAPEHLGLAEMGKAGGNCILQAPIFLSAVSGISFVRHDCSPALVSFGQRRCSNKDNSGIFIPYLPVGNGMSIPGDTRKRNGRECRESPDNIRDCEFL